MDLHSSSIVEGMGLAEHSMATTQLHLIGGTFASLQSFSLVGREYFTFDGSSSLFLHN